MYVFSGIRTVLEYLLLTLTFEHKNLLTLVLMHRRGIIDGFYFASLLHFQPKQTITRREEDSSETRTTTTFMLILFILNTTFQRLKFFFFGLE